MTVIRPNSISGITSITAQANEINVFKSDGTLAGLSLNGVNVNTTTGISTYAALNVTGNISIGGTLTYQDVTNVDSVGVITARSAIDAQGTINLADSIIHTGDTNTKIRFPAADTITAETNGSEKIRITGLGLVGINETTPDSKVDIVYSSSTDTATQNLIHLRTDPSSNYATRGLFIKVGRDGIYDNSSVHYDVVGSSGNSGVHIFEVQGSEKLRIDKSGQMGLGGTPTHKLEIFNAADTENILMIRGADATTEYAAMGVSGGNAVITGGGVGSTNAGISFRTAASGTEGERMRITSTGRLGLGTNNPSCELHVSGANPRSRFTSTGNTVNYDIFMGSSNATVGTQSNHDLLFMTNDSERLRINSSGKVSIASGAYGGGGTTPELYVRGTSGRQMKIHNSNASTSSLQITNATTGEGEDAGTQLFTQGGTGDFHILNAYATGDIVFHTKASGGSTTERLRIQSDGVIAPKEKVMGTHPFRFGGFGSIGSNQCCRITGGTGSHPAGLSFDGGGTPTLEMGSTTSETIIGTNSYNNLPMNFKTAMGIATLSGGTTRFQINSNGNIGAPTGNNIYNASDERLKENMVELTDGLSKIQKLKPISFTWKEGWDVNLDGKKEYGFGAQTTEAVDEMLVEPFALVDAELNGEIIEKPLRVNEKYIIPLLVKAVQELSAEVAALKAK